MSLKCRWIIPLCFVLSVTGRPLSGQIPDGQLYRRISQASRFEFGLFNSGLLYGPGMVNIMRASWPRGASPWAYDQMYYPFGFTSNAFIKGLIFLAQKNGEYYIRDASSIESIVAEEDHGPFYDMVPGRIGDPLAGYDSKSGGIGWKYQDDRDYVVYSSKDYDTNGVDISGSNYNDWPMRLVNGSPTYVPNYLERPKYKPVYASDEDFFTIYKDTDVRAYRKFQKRSPLELEVQQYVYTWASSCFRDMLIFRYDLINKSPSRLDSCYFLWDSGLSYRVHYSNGGDTFFPHITDIELSHNLVYQQPFDTIFQYTKYPLPWVGTPYPPTMGYSILTAPSGDNGEPGRLMDGGSYDRFTYQYLRFSGLNPVDVFWDTVQSEEILYKRLRQNKIITPEQYGSWRLNQTPVLLTTPFTLMPGDTARLVIAMIFAENRNSLALRNSLIKRVYAAGMKLPTPPLVPTVTIKPLDRGVYLAWDKTAEKSVDAFIPSTLGKSFYGYRVYRATQKDGPYKLLKECKWDSLAHDYLDKGEDIGGLKNNVTYYYKVTSFDEGAPSIDLDPMESQAFEGRNFYAVIPSTKTSNTAISTTFGSAKSGTLGDITSVTLVPVNNGNFNALFSGHGLKVTLNANTDGTKYYLPVTIRDTLSNKVHNDVIDPGLFVHGSSATKGMKKGTAVINDVFGVGGANLEVGYQFEQLGDSLKVHAAIVSTSGADVPVIIHDSPNYTGITYSPYMANSKTLTLRFAGGGIDTVNRTQNWCFPYLTVELYDSEIGALIDAGNVFESMGFCQSTSKEFTKTTNRYYLSGTMSNGERWDFAGVLTINSTRIAFDFMDRGIGSGGLVFPWGSPHRSGTKDFRVGDSVSVSWTGGVKAVFPQQAELIVGGANAVQQKTTDAMMEKIRIVPNPYLVRHEAQRGAPRLYFNNLPDECVIRIYTLALDLVKTIRHSGDSREEWDLQTEGGQLVASQMLYAYIDAPTGAKTIKKFSVIVGR